MGRIKEQLIDTDCSELDDWSKGSPIIYKDIEELESENPCPCEYGICSECSYCNIDYNVC